MSLIIDALPSDCRQYVEVLKKAEHLAAISGGHLKEDKKENGVIDAVSELAIAYEMIREQFGEEAVIKLEKLGLSIEAIDPKRKEISEKELKTCFQHWKNNFTENIAEHLVVFDPLKSVKSILRRPSESLAYGMIFTSWLKDDNLFTQLDRTFDDLYLVKKGNKKGLAAWSINDQGKYLDSNSAADADQDLTIAYIKRWKDTGKAAYREKAQALLDNIRQKEVVEYHGMLILKPSSGFGENSSDRSVTINVSYFTPAYYDVFAKFDKDHAEFWQKLKTDSYKILDLVYNKYGHFCDWVKINWKGDNLIFGPDFSRGEVGLKESLDGIRTIWRIACDWQWNKDSRAQNLLKKVMKDRRPDNVEIDQKRFHIVPIAMYASGALGTGNSEQIKAFRTAMDKAFVEEGYFSFGDPKADRSYYNQSLALLSEILLTGIFVKP